LIRSIVVPLRRLETQSQISLRTKFGNSSKEKGKNTYHFY